MNQLLKYVPPALAAAIVETGLFLAATYGVSASHPALDIAVAYAGGYLTLVAALHVLGPPSATSGFGAQLRSYAPIGMASVLLAVVVLHLCSSGLDLNPVTSNAATLGAVAIWIALGWPFVRGKQRSALTGEIGETPRRGRAKE